MVLEHFDLSKVVILGSHFFARASQKSIGMIDDFGREMNLFEAKKSGQPVFFMYVSC